MGTYGYVIFGIFYLSSSFVCAIHHEACNDCSPDVCEHQYVGLLFLSYLTFVIFLCFLFSFALVSQVTIPLCFVHLYRIRLKNLYLFSNANCAWYVVAVPINSYNPVYSIIMTK